MKGANIFASELRPIVLRSLKVFAACANSLTVVACEDADLPALNGQDTNFLFSYLGAFASLREIPTFDCGSAAFGAPW
jgi:hypothetical protein